MTHRRFIIPAALAFFCGAVSGLPPPAKAADHVPVLVYGSFGAEGPRAVKLEQFETQLNEIANGGWQVLPLSEIVMALRKRKPVPARAIAISIDDAHESVFTEAWPRLKRAGLPFTLFVSTGALDRSAPGYMSWAQLRTLSEAGVEIGNLTVSQPHMAQQTDERNGEEIATAQSRIREETGQEPQLFAYPYGEWTPAVRRQVIQSGFLGAFGQQSGVAHAGADWFSFPRFPINENLGGLSRFLMAATALPLVVVDVEPAGTVIETTRPRIAFTVDPEAGPLDRLACFASSEPGPLGLLLGDDRRVEITLTRELPVGRTRINCTLPAAEGRWQWFGLQLNPSKGG